MTKRTHFEAQGFTLIELVAVIILIGLIAGLTTPVIMSTLDRIQIQSAVREIASTLRYTRSQAIALKKPVAFNADIDKKQYWLTNLKTKEKSKVKSLAREIFISEFTNGEDVISDGDFSITFYPQGSTSGGSILLVPTDEDYSENWYRIVLDPATGRPALEQNEE